MSEDPQTSTAQEAASSEPASAVQSASTALQSSGAQVAASADEHPELVVGAAFGGGLLFALILKRLAR